MLQMTAAGLYCEAGDFHIDPWRAVDHAIITHGHSDHARAGSKQYYCAEPSVPVLKTRLGKNIRIQGWKYQENYARNDVSVSLWPAGHILGAAQVRIERRGEVWCVSGDYKTERDPTCALFEPVRCHTFVTECTFGLPIYRWPDPERVAREINEWRLDCHSQGQNVLLCGYSLGKAQRLLAHLKPDVGPILLHGAVDRLMPAYQAARVKFPEYEFASVEAAKRHKGRATIIAPPSASGAPWVRKFQPYSLAMASGWMRIRGARRRGGADRGFVLSDHVDWPSLIDTIQATGAENIWVTHGFTENLARWLNEKGWNATALETRFTGESEDDAQEVESEPAESTQDTERGS